MSLKLLFTLFSALPELLALVRTLEENNKELQVEKKVKDDLKVISKAFEEKNAEALNSLFNS